MFTFLHPRRLVRVRFLRALVLLVAYTLCTAACLAFSYELRFDFQVPPEYRESFAKAVCWVVPLQLLFLALFGQFRDSLSYFSVPDFRQIFSSCAGSAACMLAATLFFGVAVSPPRSVILIDSLLCGLALSLGRGALRFARERYLAPQTRPTDEPRRVAIVGVGDAGAALARELMSNRWLGLRPIAFFDDIRVAGTRVHGIPVWGRPEHLVDPKMALMIDEAIIAMPAAEAVRRREVVRILQRSKIPFRTVPSTIELAMGSGEVSSLRPVQIEDLLGRDEVCLDTAEIGRAIRGRCVLVTGAGGSIGSELCRQIASFHPRLLVLVERAEPALFAIEQELIERSFHHLIEPCVADITNAARMRSIFAETSPEIVFHAAAHKHVPMMESQPDEAITNNVLGTAALTALAAEHGVERFLLISTDKAVNPTSVMGATKRLAEIVVQAMQGTAPARTQFMAVRFGNVLGSSGSVVPTFTRQIAAGGPITVTHPDVTRFFMSIPEAVSLVLQSCLLATGGEIFVLDMGEPVKIVDLARQMIELSGRKPDRDIRIEFTGLRPGEKLFEELSHHAENVMPTRHPQIRRLVCTPAPFTRVAGILAELSQAITERPAPDLKRLLGSYIPEYEPAISEAAHLDGINRPFSAAGRQASPESREPENPHPSWGTSAASVPEPDPTRAELLQN